MNRSAKFGKREATESLPLQVIEGDSDGAKGEKHPVVVVLDSIRSAYNTGAMIRTAECAGVDTVYLCGITATPPNRRLEKTALRAARNIKWVYNENAFDAILSLKKIGYQIISIETTNRSESIWDIKIDPPCAIVFGHEVTGIGIDILEASDIIAGIPLFGRKNSLNVATAFGITLYEVIRKIHR